MAGYSGTPLAKKLGIKPGSRVCLLDAPDAIVNELTGSSDGAQFFSSLRGKTNFHVILAFFRSENDLAKRFSALRDRLEDRGGLWISWPKKASGQPTDVSESVVRRIGLAGGLVDNKICAVDEEWSGLRFVERLATKSPKRKVVAQLRTRRS